jgi:capsular polysaccharide biosynthesis protein
VVPSRSVALHAWAHPEAHAVWDRIASGFRGHGGSDRVYVSRSALNERRRAEGHRRPIRTTAETDRALDEVFAGHGFTLLQPEKLDIDGQLRAVASASVIAGLSGSGLHHSAFLPGGGHVLEVGDGRGGTEPVRMQVAIDAACGHLRHFVPGDTGPRDVDRVLTRLLGT